MIKILTNHQNQKKNEVIKVPFIGDVNIENSPLILSTALIAFVDGFNPCSLWLIVFLLGMVLHSGSRKKVLIVSLTFLTVTASAYGAFMLGLFNVLSYVGYIKWIQMVVAGMAIIFAIVNIKDYFWFKEGISFTISDKHKPNIFKKMREAISGDKSMFAMVTGTASMALGVVLVELPCTAGFPVIWSNILAQKDVDTMMFILLFAIYILIYLIDELAVILTAVITLKISRFEEKHGRILKLISGFVMASLGIFMVANPEMMRSLNGTLVVFGTAAGLSITVLVLHRIVLPKFGIKIGSEEIK